MPLATVADARWNGLKVVAESCSEHDHKDRILEALGPLGEQLPSVDERTCSGYYKYLKARLSFPFTAHYPEPMNSEEEDEFRCTVSELLDPAEHLGDGFDGVFCTTCKDQYELKLPLIDLYLPEDSFSFQVINDYWFWYWNWH